MSAPCTGFTPPMPPDRRYFPSRTRSRSAPEAGRLWLQRRAFTLIELLVVIAIIAILASLLLPALTEAQNNGKTSVCGNQIRQLGQAVAHYANDFDDWPPTAAGLRPDGSYPYKQFCSWPYLLHSYVGMEWKPYTSYVQSGPPMFYCPMAKPKAIYGWSTLRDLLAYGYNTYFDTEGGSYHTRVPNITRPDLTLCIAEYMDYREFNACSSVMTGYWNLNSVSTGTGADQFAFRHRNTMHVLYFDGHVKKQSRRPDSKPHDVIFYNGGTHYR